MIRLQRGVLALMVVAITHVPAVAQSYEMSGLVAFTPSAGLDRQAPEVTDLNIRGGFTWGVQGARFFTPQWGAEVMWTQQASALEVATPEGAADLYSVTVAQLQANVVYQFGDENARLRPFVFGGAGASFFSARDLDTEAKAAFGFGGGVKYFPWTNVGVRGHFRYKPTRLNADSDGDVCNPFSYCQSWLQPIEIAGGVTLRF